MLRFREQADGRKVARLPGGKAVLVEISALDRVGQKFLDFLSHAGYIVRRKPVKVIEDAETGERIF